MSQAAARHNDAVPWIDLEQNLWHETPRQWAARFNNASPNECNRLLLALTRHATNTQITRLLNILDHKYGRHQLALQNWRATLTRLSPNIFSEYTRYKLLIREREDHWLLHYRRAKSSRSNVSREPNPVIIGITGSAGLLMAPIPCVLAAIAHTQYDLIVVRRRYKESYFSNNGHLFISIGNHLHLKLKDKLQSSILLGTSNGGLAALCMGNSLRLQLSIAIGAGADADTFLPNSPVNQAAQKLRIPTLAIPWRIKKTRLLLAASAENLADHKSALLISDHFNHHHQRSAHATAMLFSGCSNHSLPEDLAHKGIPLEQLLIPLLNNNLNNLPEHRKHC